jgi:hypothetical protein
VREATDRANGPQLPMVINTETTLSETTNAMEAGIIRLIENNMSDQKGILQIAEQITCDVEAEIRMTDTLQCVEEGDRKTTSLVREVQISKDGKR